MKKILFVLLINLLNINLLLAQSQPANPNKESTKTQGEKAWEFIEYMDDYYEKNYFSKGIKKTDMSGSGYYPYQRMKHFYEMRANADYEIPFLQRWNAYEESQRKLLENGKVTVTADWQCFGPTNQGGRTLSYAFDPTDSQILWIGSASGGLWRSLNGGDSWEPMTDNLPSLAVGGVAIHPYDPNIMVIGTGEAYGSSLMVNGVGILKSIDRGLTWNQTDFIFQQTNGVCCYTMVWDPNNSNMVYAGFNNGFWRSTDGGDTWVITHGGRTTAIVLNKKSPGTIYIAIQSLGILKSTNYGLSWTLLTNGLPSSPSVGFTSLAICDSFPNILYAGMSTNSFFGSVQGFFKTNNGGDSWHIIPSPEFYCYPPPYNNLCQGGYDNVTACSPIDSNIVFSNGINLYKSVNGGISWTNPAGRAPNPVSVHVDHHNFAFDPNDPNTVYAFTDGGVYKSTNLGQAWAEKNDGLITFQFYSIASAYTDTNIVSGGTQDNSTYYVNTSGGNTEWTRWWGGDGMVSNIDYTNSQIMYGEKQFGDHGKTTNGGLSSFSINNGITETGPWVTPVVMHPTDPAILYTASDLKIYKTTNGGLLWAPVANIPNCYFLEIDEINPDVVYAYCISSSGHYFWKSDSADAGWTLATSPGWRVTDIEASPAEEGVIYATRNNGDAIPHIYKSADYGENWLDISGDMADIGANAIAINPHNPSHLYLATDLGVYASLNDGNEWFAFNDNLPNVWVYDIHIHPVDTTVRVGTHGRGYWKTKAVKSSINSINKSNKINYPKSFELSKNYPNPFNPQTTIEYTLQKNSNVSVKIFNELGQQVKQLFSGVQKSGSYRLVWNGKNENGLEVTSGTYIFRITVDGISQAQKMVFLK